MCLFNADTGEIKLSHEESQKLSGVSKIVVTNGDPKKPPRVFNEHTRITSDVRTLAVVLSVVVTGAVGIMADRLAMHDAIRHAGADRWGGAHVAQADEAREERNPGWSGLALSEIREIQGRVRLGE